MQLLGRCRAWQLLSLLAAAVPFEGRAAAVSNPRLRAPLLLHVRSGSQGVRDGAGPSEEDRDPENFGDGQLVSSDWTSASMVHEFGFLDNLEPIAPMDGVSPPSSVVALGPDLMPAEHHNSLFIPPYRNPDAFPVVAGETCTCETPAVTPPTQQQKDWAKTVARQLGIKVSEMPKPLSPEGLTKCECPSGDGSGATYYHWMNLEPIGHGRKFTISPADISYNAGNFWEPALRGGLAAPQDRMPIKAYPLQATADHIEHVPTVGREDRISSKFARYIDQVEASSQRCDGDGVTERCVTECQPGDVVTAELGHLRASAKIISTHIGGAVVIQYRPPSTRGAGGAACPADAFCSMFRPCRKLGAWCVELEGKRSRDYLGNLKLSLQCPSGTQECGSVTQVVGGKYLRKGDKLCKPVGAAAKKPPPI